MTALYVRYLLPVLFLMIVSGCSKLEVEKTIAEGGVKMTSAELDKMLAGRIVHMTEYDSKAIVKFSDDGYVVGKNDRGETSKGRWLIDEKERLCVKFKKWGFGDQVCSSVYKVGDEYRQFNSSGLWVGTFTLGPLTSQTQQSATEEDPVKSAIQATAPAPPPGIGPTPPAQPLASEITPAPQTQLQKVQTSLLDKARNCPGCDLQRVNLANTDLSQAHLPGADLEGANLHNVNLKMANLKGASLVNADLSKANLAGADLAGADLTGANLSGAELYGTNLKGTTLDNVKGADFRGAIR